MSVTLPEATGGGGGFPASHVVSFPYFLVIGYSAMLAKKTVKNQITLPKKIADRFPRVEYFDVRAEDDRIILEPLKADRAAQVREKLARLKLTEADVAKAVAWARKARS
jgi:hypothetical protein